MTPAATTPAARKAQHRPGRPSKRPSKRPFAPRRVSGPVGGRTAATASARAATAPGIALPRRPRVRRPPATAARLRIGAFVRSLPDHRLLDRLIRGRWWIPVLGVMLAGIVAMQVEVLKLGASMGRSLQRNSVLSSRNAALRQSVATLGDDQRVEQLAASMGMVMPPPQAVAFLAAHPDGSAARAAANIHTPSASSFLSMTPANGEIVTAATLAAANAPSDTTASTSTIGATPTSTSSTTSTSSGATSPVAAAPTVPSTAASSAAATPTAVSSTPTSVSSASSSSSTPSSTQTAAQSQSSASGSGPSTGAAAVAPPSTNSGG